MKILTLQDGSAWFLVRTIPSENNGGSDECFWNGVSWSLKPSFAVPFRSQASAEEYLRENLDKMRS